MRLLKTVFGYKEGVFSFSLMVIGVLLCFVAGNLIKHETLSFSVIIIGGFMSLTGSTEFGKVLMTVRKMLDEEK